MAGSLHELTDATFEAEVLNSKGLVLVDLWAPWCGPCLRLTPTLEALAVELAGKARVVKVNV
ncbi:MAG TPA: thiol reductase thioredoxin, partial [Planctomycetaceae bacterium]|nr:thiol reductase thioredoxin [Planctomycetaceae bacterium]